MANVTRAYPKRSWVWTNFIDTPNGTHAKCNTCGHLVSRTSKNTKDMIDHMKLHKISAETFKRRKMEEDNLNERGEQDQFGDDLDLDQEEEEYHNQIKDAQMQSGQSNSDESNYSQTNGGETNSGECNDDENNDGANNNVTGKPKLVHGKLNSFGTKKKPMYPTQSYKNINR